MSSRLYYTDSYTTRFRSSVVETTHVDGRTAVTLEQTYFYPTSGGQPHDTGRLGSARVVDVRVGEPDGTVVHLLDREIPAGEMDAEVDWGRRFDHMQQHTGQHILSQAFIRVAQAPTIGFHLGDQYVSIDLDTGALSEESSRAAFELANQQVAANLPVRAWFPTADELPTLALRKTPEVAGALRVVAVGDFDRSACGGTHVAATGEIGLIHLLRTERMNRGTRVAFLCGDRARRDYARKHGVTSRLSAALTCSVEELEGTVARIREELAAARNALAAQHEAELDAEAAALAATASRANGLATVQRVWDRRPAEELRGLALRVTSSPGTLALLGSAGEKAQLVLARSEDLTLDLRPALHIALKALGGGKGGGGRVVQGGGPPADLAAVGAALDAARATLGL